MNSVGHRDSLPRPRVYFEVVYSFPEEKRDRLTDERLATMYFESHVFEEMSRPIVLRRFESTSRIDPNADRTRR